jgi:hypothetical protein
MNNDVSALDGLNLRSLNFVLDLEYHTLDACFTMPCLTCTYTPAWKNQHILEVVACTRLLQVRHGEKHFAHQAA